MERFKINERTNEKCGYNVDFYDTHKRDGWGIYTEKCNFMNDNSHISISTLRMMTDKMNELYNENQSLKEGSSYHQVIIKKIDELIDEFEYYQLRAYEKYMDSESEKDKIVYQSYMDVSLSLQYIRDVAQGEEYE